MREPLVLWKPQELRRSAREEAALSVPLTPLPEEEEAEAFRGIINTLGERPAHRYRCDACAGMPFPSREELREHVKQVHPQVAFSLVQRGIL